MAFPKTFKHPSGRPLTLDPSRALLAFVPAGRPQRLAAALKAAGLVPEDRPSPRGRPRIVNQGPRYYFVRAKDGKLIPDDAESKLRTALGRGRGVKLAWMGPVYRFVGTDSDRGLAAPVLDALHLRLREPLDAKGEKVFTSALKRAALSAGRARGKSARATLKTSVDIAKHTSLEASAMLEAALGNLLAAAHPDWIPLISPVAATPFTETFWSNQWNMVQIGAEAAWDETTGDPTVFVCVIDRAIERGHEELNRASNRGYEATTPTENTGTVGGGGATDITYPADPTAPDAPHGTAIASIAVARWDVFGVAGLAGGASLFALAAPNWTAGEVEDAIERARDLAAAPVGGASKRVILLGGISMAWAGTGVQGSIDAALTDGILVCCPSGNTDIAGIEYPGDGTHPGIVVCGSSDMADARWLSSYGPTLSLVAPGRDIPVADLTGPDGYDAADYYLGFEGSSAGAAHTAGLGALMLSSPNLDFATYPGATIGAKLKSVIERTAEKVGAVAYNTDINARNDEMGFGRIRADWAMTLADVMIRDAPTDTGVEPSTGVFWRDSDIVARRDAELLADVTSNWDTWHADYNQSRLIQVKADMTASYCYVRIRNLGPATATNVRVRLVAAMCATGFMYPTDWNAVEDADHVVMTPDPWPGDNAAIGDLYDAGDLAVGAVKIVRFQVSYTQGVKVRDTWGAGHACALCRVTADNDHAFNQFAPAAPVGGEQTRRNNLVQRNLTAVTATSPWFFPFLASNIEDPDEDLELVIDAVDFPAGALIRLALDDPERAFPGYLARTAGAREAALTRSRARALVRGPDASITLLDRARFRVECGNAEGILTIEPGSRFDYLGVRTDSKIEAVGANVVLDRGKRVVETRGKQARIRMKKQPFGALPLYLEIPVPPGTRPEDRFLVDVIQKNRAGEVMGGISLWLIP